MLRLRSHGLEWREVDGEVIALDIPGAVYLGANQSASGLWDALAQGATREQLVERLMAGYRIGRADAERDVDAFISQLRDRGLLGESED